MQKVDLHSTEAELSLLGACLLDHKCFDRVSDFLAPHHFFDKTNAEVFEIFRSLIGSGRAATRITLKPFLADLAGMDFDKYMIRLATEATTLVNSEHYGRTIRDLAIRRQVVAFCEDTITKATNPDPDVETDQQLVQIERDLAALAASTGHGAGRTTKKRLLQSSAEFVRDFTPPDYLIDGFLQRRFLYSLTGKTGSGKTAIELLLAASIALGRPIGSKEVQQGRVLYSAGENPDDVRMRWIAMSQQMDFDIDTVDVHFVPGVFSISGLAERVHHEVEQLGGVCLVVIDTTAAYFEGDDENSNAQMGRYARMQRSLVGLPGGPAVMALCHPVKNAGDENLLPRGGGAYLNEVDGNLTAKNNQNMVEVHWQGKFRGPDFAPLLFQLRTVTHERLKDSNGRQLRTVEASHLSEAGENELRAIARSNEDKLLALLSTNKGASHADLARLAGWNMKDGEPYKVMVRRILAKLKKDGLIDDARDGPELTDAGRKQLKKTHSSPEQ